MTQQGSADLARYISDLKKIISELKGVESAVRNDYKNIGNDKCADSIQSVIEKFEESLRTLESVSPGTIEKLIEESKDKPTTCIA